MAVVTKLEFKFQEKDAYQVINITGYTGSYNEKPQETPAGLLYNSAASAYVPNINMANDTLLYSIVARKAIFRITDSEGIVHEIGNNLARVTLEIEKVNDGKPGAKHGYNLKINYNYHQPAKLTVL